MGFMSPDMPEDTAAAEEAKRQERIKAGMADIENTFGQFTPEFFGERSKAYEEFAMPQVEDQYKRAGEDLIYALTRQFGTTETSEAAKRRATLARRYAEAKSQVGGAAADYATKARQDVERERSALVGQLQSTADPAAAAANAMRSSELLQAPESYSPLGDLFGDVTAGLATGAYPYGAVEYASKLFGTSGKKQPASSIVT